jgi:hypothetical protein
MEYLFYLLAAYGLCFGLQHKTTILHDRHPVVDALFQCTYCTGVHCGWMMWLLVWGATGTPPATGLSVAPSVLIWSLASGIWCYGMDVWTSWLESDTKQDV